MHTLAPTPRAAPAPPWATAAPTALPIDGEEVAQLLNVGVTKQTGPRASGDTANPAERLAIASAVRPRRCPGPTPSMPVTPAARPLGRAAAAFLPAALLPAALLALSSAPAAAQPPPAPAADAADPNQAAKDKARELANKGAEQFRAGDYEKAIASFERAERVFHAPTILLRMALAYERLGRLLAARAVYRRIAAESLASYAPSEFFVAQKQARDALEALPRRIPTLQIDVEGAPPDRIRLTVDGATVPPEAGPLLYDPGRHAVVATAPGRPTVTRTIALPEGASELVRLVLPAPSPQPIAPASFTSPGEPLAGAAASPSPDDPSAPGSLAPAAFAFGVGAVGLGVGVVAGALTLSKVDALQERCPNNVCDESDRPDYDAATTLSAVSVVGFVVGGVGVAAGIVLVAVRPGGGPSPSVGVTLGPGYAALRGAF